MAKRIKKRVARSQASKRRVSKRVAVSRRVEENRGLAAVAYLLGAITGIIILLVAEKEDKYARFHAMQSILLCVATAVIAGILLWATLPFSVMGMHMWFINPFAVIVSAVWLVYTVGVMIIWVILIIKAYSGERYKLPLLGDLAEDFIK